MGVAVAVMVVVAGNGVAAAGVADTEPAGMNPGLESGIGYSGGDVGGAEVEVDKDLAGTGSGKDLGSKTWRSISPN